MKEQTFLSGVTCVSASNVWKEEEEERGEVKEREGNVRKRKREEE